MAKVDDKVMSLVQDELQKNPSASVDELYDKAKSISSGIGKLSKRQFNARYPLQVKRKMGGMGGGKRSTRKTTPRASRRPAASSGGSREAVRDVLLRFASDLAGAEQRKDLVKVLASVDKYVDEIVKASSK